MLTIVVSELSKKGVDTGTFLETKSSTWRELWKRNLKRWLCYL
jgi:hypothetical protein